MDDIINYHLLNYLDLKTLAKFFLTRRIANSVVDRLYEKRFSYLDNYPSLLDNRRWRILRVCKLLFSIEKVNAVKLLYYGNQSVRIVKGRRGTAVIRLESSLSWSRTPYYSLITPRGRIYESTDLSTTLSHSIEFILHSYKDSVSSEISLLGDSEKLFFPRLGVH